MLSFGSAFLLYTQKEKGGLKDIFPIFKEIFVKEILATKMIDKAMIFVINIDKGTVIARIMGIKILEQQPTVTLIHKGLVVIEMMVHEEMHKKML